MRERENESEEALTTYVYAAQVDEAARLEQAFTFHSTSASGQFAGTTFNIGAGSVKWSVNITSQLCALLCQSIIRAWAKIALPCCASQ